MVLLLDGDAWCCQCCCCFGIVMHHGSTVAAVAVSCDLVVDGGGDVRSNALKLGITSAVSCALLAILVLLIVVVIDVHYCWCLTHNIDKQYTIKYRPTQHCRDGILRYTQRCLGWTSTSIFVCNGQITAVFWSSDDTRVAQHWHQNQIILFQYLAAKNEDHVHFFL